MRAAALALLLLAGCGPRVIRSYQWGPAHVEAIWIWHEGHVQRCYLSTRGPICAVAPRVDARPPLPMAGITEAPVLSDR